MSTITLHISNDDNVNVSQSPETSPQPSSIPAGDAIDGGAPRVDSANNAQASSAGQTDIGGPPQWLTEALGKEAKTSATAGLPGSAEKASDGGAPRAEGT